MNKLNELTVIQDESGAFTDRSIDAVDFTQDPVNTTLVVDDFIYVGLHKPFSCFYIELNEFNLNESITSVEYFNGTNWVESKVQDGTKGLKRSSYISWTESENMQKTTVDSSEKFFIRISVDNDTSQLSILGINLVFSSDADLKLEFPEALDDCFYPKGFTSHIISHIAARNHILQALRSCNIIKTNSETGEENITQWDLLDISEVRQASMYLALSKIAFNQADSQESIWWTKYISYQNKYEEAFELARLTLDRNDNGVVDQDEKLKSTSNRWVR